MFHLVYGGNLIVSHDFADLRIPIIALVANLNFVFFTDFAFHAIYTRAGPYDGCLGCYAPAFTHIGGNEFFKGTGSSHMSDNAALDSKVAAATTLTAYVRGLNGTGFTISVSALYACYR
jgi:hypothetical protein